MQANTSPKLPFRIGCPVWQCEHWANSVYPAGTAQAKRLSWYTKMFNTVEGNSSFYGIPSESNAARWAREAADGFEFCMKFPREISHDRMLVGAERATSDFLRMLYVLAEAGKAGPAFLQLGPDFCPQRIASLEKYLSSLPADLSWAVEVRHMAWFDEGKNETELQTLLRDLGMDQTLFDSRALYQLPPNDESERVSQTRKPKSPLRRTVTGKRPMLRIVGRNQVELTHTFIQDWLPTLVGWIADGLEPIVFTHAPDDTYAPQFARDFFAFVAHEPNFEEAYGHCELPKLPPVARQLDLFS